MKLNLNQRTAQIARSLAIIGGTGAIVVGATMAATTSVGTASLTGNTFAVGSGGILIASDNSGTAGTFGTTATGFNFGSLTEGGTGTTHEHFWLQNATDTTVTLTAAATDVSTSSNLDPTKVTVHIEKTGTTDDNAATLASLSSGTENISDVPAAGASSEYDVWVTLDSGALSSGTSATGSFGLDFTGNTTQ